MSPDRERRARRAALTYLIVFAVSLAAVGTAAACCAHGGASSDAVLSLFLVPVVLTLPGSLLVTRLLPHGPAASSSLPFMLVVFSVGALINAALLYGIMRGRFGRRGGD